MGNRMNADATATNVRDFRTSYATVEDDPSRPSFIQRRLLDIGVLEMAPSTRPPGLNINITSATFILLVLGMIAGGFWWTWQRGHEAGVNQGKQDAVIQQLNERLDKAESKAASAEKMATYAAAGADETAGHKKK